MGLKHNLDEWVGKNVSLDYSGPEWGSDVEPGILRITADGEWYVESECHIAWTPWIHFDPAAVSYSEEVGPNLVLYFGGFKPILSEPDDHGMIHILNYEALPTE